MIVIVDFGLGNVESIRYKLLKEGQKVLVSKEKKELQKATKLIMPGVGNFKKAMVNLEKYEILDVLNDLVLNKKIPILGICLGMQLFFEHSQEGDSLGLGWIKGKITKFESSDSNFKIPHVGWNSINLKKDSSFFNSDIENQNFYFTHSYYANCSDSKDVLGITNYGQKFVSLVEKNNIVGTQFHPEKSHYEGFRIIKIFANA